MLEVLYDTTTKEVRAWNADMSVKGKLKPKEGQEVVIWDIPIPKFDSREYKVDEANQTVVDGNPDYVAPIPFNTRAEIDELKEEIRLLKGR